MKAIISEMTATNITFSKEDMMIGQLSTDLNNYIGKFDKKMKGYESIATVCGTTVRTVQRMAKGTHKTSVERVLKVYQYLLSEANDKQSFEEALPLAILNYVSDSNYYNMLTFTPKVDVSRFQKLMKENTTFRKLYILVNQANDKNPLTVEKAMYRFGSEVQKNIDLLLEMELVRVIDNRITLIKSNAPSWESETSYRVAAKTVEDDFNSSKMEKGEALSGFLAGGVSEEAFSKIKEIEKRAFAEIEKILSDESNDGDIELFRSVFLSKAS